MCVSMLDDGEWSTLMFVSLLGDGEWSSWMYVFMSQLTKNYRNIVMNTGSIVVASSGHISFA